MSTSRRILVIDDDPAFAKGTSLLLQAHGYEVDSAKNADEGLAKMQQQKPDLVLLDVMMDSVLDGVYVSDEMLHDSALRGIPILMVTSIADTEYLQQFPQDQYLHIDGWMLKPCDPPKLIAEVDRLVKRREHSTAHI